MLKVSYQLIRGFKSFPRFMNRLQNVRQDKIDKIVCLHIMYMIYATHSMSYQFTIKILLLYETQSNLMLFLSVDSAGLYSA